MLGDALDKIQRADQRSACFQDIYLGETVAYKNCLISACFQDINLGETVAYTNVLIALTASTRRCIRQKYLGLAEGMLLVEAALHHRSLKLPLSVLSLSFDCLATQLKQRMIHT